VVSGFSRTSRAGGLRIAGLFVFRHDPSVRAEHAAALANFLLMPLGTAGLMMAFSPSSQAHVYSNPAKASVQFAVMAVLVGAPLGAIASWRTWVHARHYLLRETRGWQGVVEAGVLGFALTLPLVLPGVVARQFDPGPWGQPGAFMLGLAYVGFYGLFGLFIGLVLGMLLRLSAIAVLLVHRRVAS
jgi:hypothetical protein